VRIVYVSNNSRENRETLSSQTVRGRARRNYEWSTVAGAVHAAREDASAMPTQWFITITKLARAMEGSLSRDFSFAGLLLESDAYPVLQYPDDPTAKDHAVLFSH
jgi:hypothetical protein